MKNRKVLVIGIIIIFIIVVLWILPMPKYELDSAEKERIQNEVLNNMETLTSSDVTAEDFKRILGNDIVNVSIAVGKDCYLRNKPASSIISKYHLSDLEVEQEELVKKVEERYLSNLEYNIVNQQVDGSKLCEEVEIKTYYYSLYLYDYINITTALLPFDIQDVVENEEAAVEYYKAELKALRVLDKHLDDYENITNEKENISVCYVNGDIISNDEALNLNLALQGNLYSNMDFSKQENVDVANQRLNNYLKEIEEMAS